MTCCGHWRQYRDTPCGTLDTCPRNAERDSRILDAAIELAKRDGYQWITRAAIARVAGMSPAAVSNYGCNQPSAGGKRGDAMLDIKRAVLHAAVAREILPIVAQGLADGHAIVLAAPRDLRERAVAQAVGA